MRALAFLVAGVLPVAALAAPAHFDVGDTHVIVVRPIDNWDPNKTTAEYSLDGLRSKNFGFQYIDAAGTKEKDEREDAKKEIFALRIDDNGIYDLITRQLVA